MSGADTNAIVGSAFFGDNVVNFVTGFAFDGSKSIFREQSGEWLARNIGPRPKGKCAVAMFGDLERVDRFRVDVEFF